jgi:hypothetical protein
VPVPLPLHAPPHTSGFAEDVSGERFAARGGSGDDRERNRKIRKIRRSEEFLLIF